MTLFSKRKTLIPLFALVAAASVTGLPALATAPKGASCGAAVCAIDLWDSPLTLPLIRVSDDDDDDDDYNDDDDDDRSACDNGDSDDDHGCKAGGRAPGTVQGAAPPANGLFGGGAPPVAVTR